jgi:DNA polymerase
VVCTLGNFSTKLLREDNAGITGLHGKPEVRVIGPRAVRLYPLFHPAAALYQRSNVDLLREDFARIPDLLKEGPPEQPSVEEEVVAEAEVVEPPDDGAEQLDLFG